MLRRIFKWAARVNARYERDDRLREQLHEARARCFHLEAEIEIKNDKIENLEDQIGELHDHIADLESRISGPHEPTPQDVKRQTIIDKYKRLKRGSPL